MNGLRLYLDTSVWSGLFAERQPEHRHWGKLLLDHARDSSIQIYASDTVLAEFARAPEDLRDRLVRALEDSEAIVLEADSRVIEFATACIDRGTIPPRYEADAMHIACAVVAGLDAVVSWNMEHIVKLKTKHDVKVLCLELGYRLVEIVTPPEVLPDAQI